MVSLREWLQPTVVRFWHAVEQKEESSYLTKPVHLNLILNALAEEKPLTCGFYFYLVRI